MSVALPSPLHNKRFLEESEDQLLEDGSRVPFTDFNPQKRPRVPLSSASRCLIGQVGSYRVGSTTIAAVSALFPQMSDKVIAEVLEEFGDNIDAAIKHLNDLQLSAPGTSERHAREEQQRQGNVGGAAPAAAAAQQAAGASDRATAPEVDAATASSADLDAQQAPPVRTAEEWVSLMVEQMSAAGDVGDARRRAGEVLQAFEQAVLCHVDGQGPSNGRTAEVERENSLLKRAVGIQNVRLQELTARAEEAGVLRRALDAARSRQQALEVQNYSLQLHLKQAADGATRDPLAGARNPHIF